jgi:hypothetical protein
VNGWLRRHPVLGSALYAYGLVLVLAASVLFVVFALGARLT